MPAIYMTAAATLRTIRIIHIRSLVTVPGNAVTGYNGSWHSIDVLLGTPALYITHPLIKVELPISGVVRFDTGEYSASRYDETVIFTLV